MESTMYTLRISRLNTKQTVTPRPRRKRKNHTPAILCVLAGFLITVGLLYEAQPTPMATSPSVSINAQDAMEKTPAPTVKVVPEPEEASIPTLINYELPDIYYGDELDFSYFQPYMDWRKITNPTTPAYAVVNDDQMYVDENGICRYHTADDQFTIDGQDDYVIALGTFYKEKGMVGNRYLITTTTGQYTAITGDEKADIHTDEHNMFVRHGENGQYAGVIEFLVESDQLPEIVRQTGTMSFVGAPIGGTIMSIQEIVE